MTEKEGQDWGGYEVFVPENDPILPLLEAAEEEQKNLPVFAFSAIIAAGTAIGAIGLKPEGLEYLDDAIIAGILFRGWVSYRRIKRYGKQIASIAQERKQKFEPITSVGEDNADEGREQA